MKKPVTVLCVSLLTAVASGQSFGGAKKFPPDAALPAKDHHVELSRRYCVAAAPVKGSISIKPCEMPPRFIRFVPPIQERQPVKQ